MLLRQPSDDSHLVANGAASGPKNSTSEPADGTDGELSVDVEDEDLHVNLAGLGAPVFAGTLNNDFPKELHATTE